MKTTSLLTQAYNKQESITPTVPNPPVESTLLGQLKANLWFFIRWFLIGGLTSGIPLAVFVVLYIRKQQGISTDSSIVSSKFANVEIRSFQWNRTGKLIAGHTNSRGVGSDQLDSPWGLALDSSDALYITDRGNHRIQKYLPNASNGRTVAGQANGLAGSLEIQLNSPSYVLVDSKGNLYITDSGNHRAQLWSNGAPFGMTFAGNGIAGSRLSQFNLAKGLARDSTTGTVYIADFYNHRIVSYSNGSRSGIVVAGGNGCGTKTNQLCQPIGVHYDAVSDSLFISNHGCHTIVRWAVGASSWTLVAGMQGTPGSSAILLNSPAGFTIDPMGNLYVADTANHRIQYFLAGNSHGTTIAGITGLPGEGLNQLNSPVWVSIDTHLNLFVADTNNHRVLKFLRY